MPAASSRAPSAEVAAAVGDASTVGGAADADGPSEHPSVVASPPATLMRTRRPPRQHLEELLVPFTVSVPVAIAHYDQTGCVLRYMIRIVDHRHGTTGIVFRRFSEVVELHDTVGSRLPATKRRLPSKLWTNRANRDVEEIEERRAALSAYFSLLIDELFINPDPPSDAQQALSSRSRSPTSSDQTGSRLFPGDTTAASSSHSESASVDDFSPAVGREAFRSRVAAFLGLKYTPRSLVPGRRRAASAAACYAVGGPMRPRARSRATTHGPADVPPSSTSLRSDPSIRREQSVETVGGGPSHRRDTDTTAVLASLSGASTSSAGQSGTAAHSAFSAADTAWEDTTQHREETWWSVPNTKLPATSSSAAAGANFHPLPADTSSYHVIDASDSFGFPAAQGVAPPRPRRRVLGFALPLMECRLQMDGDWVLIVRHDRGAPKALVRRRHHEALHLLRFLDNCSHLPTVGELREMLTAFKRRHPEHHFDDTAVRRRVAQQGFSSGSPMRRHTSGLGRKADEDDRHFNQRLSQKNLSRLRPGTDDIDELNASAVSSVSDVHRAYDAHRGGGRAGALEHDDLVTLVDLVGDMGAPSPFASSRRIRSSALRVNSAHYSYDSVTVVPWCPAPQRRTDHGRRHSAGGEVSPEANRERLVDVSPGGRVTSSTIGVLAEEGDAYDAGLERRSSNLSASDSVSSPSLTPNTLDVRGSITESVSRLVDPAHLSAPATKVKIRQRNALVKDCACDTSVFCRGGDRAARGAVFSTLSGHCIVVNPSSANVTSAGARASKDDGAAQP